MALAFIDNGIVTEYPVGIGELRRKFPNVSFPSDLQNVDLAAWGAAFVAPTPHPVVNVETESLKEQAPEFIDGAWRQVWVVEPLAPERIAQAEEQKAAAARETRNRLLSESDHTQLPDSPYDKAAWAAYRQALRDVPLSPGFPAQHQWPLQPE